MTDYASLKFTHATLKEDDQVTPRSVFLTRGAIGGFHRSKVSDPNTLVVECTVIYTIAGLFPVAETAEQVSALISNETANQGATNV